MDFVASSPQLFPHERHGVILHGEVLIASAKLLNKKDGTEQIVKLTCELVIGYEFAIIEEFVDPADERIKVAHGEVVKWPDVPRFAHVEYLAERFRTDDGKVLVATKGRFLRVVRDPDVERWMTRGA